MGWSSQQSASGIGGMSQQRTGGSWERQGSGYGSSTFGMGSRRGARRGPKGYERSDERLKEDISERMYASDDYDCSDVTVEVSGGKVTLDGSVSDRYSKYMIEEMVDSIAGVKEVDNRLRVSRGDDDQHGSSGRESSASGRSSTGTSTSIGSGSGSSTGSSASGGTSSSSTGSKRS